MSIPVTATLSNSTSSRLNDAKRDAAQIVQAINILSSEFELTDRSRVTLLAMFGISGGREEFDASYLTIAIQLNKLENINITSTPEEQSEKNLKHYQMIRRRLEQVKEQQEKLGITLMNWTPGGTLPDGTRYSSKFKLPIIEMALAAYDQAHKDPEYRKHPGKAIDRAARQIANEVLSKAKPTKIPQPPEQDPNQLTRRKFLHMQETLESQLIDAINLAIKAGWTREEIREAIDQVVGNLAKLHQKALAQLDSLFEQGVSIETQGGTIPPVQGATLFTSEQGGGGLSPLDQAKLMVAAFESVNRDSFDLTLTDGQKSVVEYTPALGGQELVERLPDVLEEAEEKELNVIIRPRPDDCKPILVQLDDLDSSEMARVRPEAFLTLNTSFNNYQCWLAMDELEKDSVSEFRRRLIASVGADLGANGAVRLAGSLNVKPQYKQSDGGYPRVKLIEVIGGLLTTPEQLEGIGLLYNSPPCVSSSGFSSGQGSVSGNRYSKGSPKQWPSYDRVFAGAYNTKSGKPDVSRVDFCWARTALQWGWGEGEVVTKLIELSPKARQRREEYAVRTVQRAARSLR